MPVMYYIVHTMCMMYNLHCTMLVIYIIHTMYMMYILQYTLHNACNIVYDNVVHFTMLAIYTVYMCNVCNCNVQFLYNVHRTYTWYARPCNVCENMQSRDLGFDVQA